ncbi:hypothetical protein [Streptomyces puniciscabiei]|uniref:hypothetical protein n=1 Tax=Streptomyces puniciscabiei TaxID=164348 RepID=UPI003327553E
MSRAAPTTRLRRIPASKPWQATTYWAHADEPRRRYPQVRLQGDVLSDLARHAGLTPSGYRAQFSRLGTGAGDGTSSVA